MNLFYASATVGQCWRHSVSSSVSRTCVCLSVHPSVHPSRMLFLQYLWHALMDLHQTVVRSLVHLGTKMNWLGLESKGQRSRSWHDQVC